MSNKIASFPTLTQEKNRLKKRKFFQRICFLFFKISMLINVAALALVVGFVFYNGIGAITWSFLTQAPRNSMTEGGILPCIIGTLALSVGALLVAFPIGTMSALYLNEYAKPGLMIRLIRIGISNLAGVPSVVFGLFGLAFFVIQLNFKVSLLSGILTLAVMALPTIIGSTEEALKSVPNTYREASLGLGATKWQTCFKVVLPVALPGILTGGILGVGRVAGETAPIMFTAAVFFSKYLPTSVFDQVMALPYHIYVLATAGTDINKTRPLQYGTSLVLITLVLGINLFAIIYRARLRKKLS